MPTDEQVRQAVTSYVEAWNVGVAARPAFMALFTADARHEDPVGSPPNLGRDAIGAFFDAIVSTSERMNLQVRELYVTAGEAALVFRVMRQLESGRVETLNGVDVFRIDDDGRIVSLKAYVNDDWTTGEAPLNDNLDSAQVIQ